MLLVILLICWFANLSGLLVYFVLPSGFVGLLNLLLWFDLSVWSCSFTGFLLLVLVGAGTTFGWLVCCFGDFDLALLFLPSDLCTLGFTSFCWGWVTLPIILVCYRGSGFWVWAGFANLLFDLIYGVLYC